MAAPFKNLLIQSRNVSKSAFYCEIRYLKTSFKEWKPRRQLFDWKHISRMFCTSVGLCGISFSYLLYKNKISGFPIAFAAEPAKDNPSSKWQAMNFIADVVEKTAPSVVYIEIQGRYVVVRYLYSMLGNRSFYFYVLFLHYNSINLYFRSNNFCIITVLIYILLSLKFGL